MIKELINYIIFIMCLSGAALVIMIVGLGV